MTAPPPALLLAVLVGLGAAVALLSRRVALRTGGAVVTFGAGEGAHDFLGRVFRRLTAAVFLYAFARAVWPRLDAVVGAVAWGGQAAVAWAGLTLILFGGAIVVSAQWQMGGSWRIGLARESTGLVTHGWFAVSRNPVFLGFLLVLAGIALCAPNALTTAFLVAGWLAMATQIRLEEAHLAAVHGSAYDAYRGRVRRWL